MFYFPHYWIRSLQDSLVFSIYVMKVKNTFKSVDDAFALHESLLQINDTIYSYKMT